MKRRFRFCTEQEFKDKHKWSYENGRPDCWSREEMHLMGTEITDEDCIEQILEEGEFCYDDHNYYEDEWVEITSTNSSNIQGVIIEPVKEFKM